jgi:NAD+ synthase
MDLVLYGKNHGYEPAEIAAEVGLTLEQVSHAFRDIEAKRRVARYLHASASIVN